MENFLTTQQSHAVKTRGNVLVMAGAGTGKTHTLVARCLNLICEEKISLDEKKFRWMLNENAMATEKTAEGIRSFNADAMKLEQFIAAKLK